MPDILLARPHPFIVSDMIPLPQRAGMSPIRPTSLSEVRVVDQTRLRGAITSLAVSSSIGASVTDVMRALREGMPRLPLLFAGLTDAAFAAQAIRRAMGNELAAVRGALETLTIPAADAGGIVVGYLSKTDLSTQQSQQAAQALLTSHFV